MKKFRIYTALFLMAPLFSVLQIAPAVGGALIIAGTSLISGILGSISANEQRKRDLLAQANQQAFESQQKGAENIGKNQQHAFGQLMDTYKSALL